LTVLVKLVWMMALEIGDDQQRRVQQRFAVLEELPVGFVQVGVLPLVLPGEVAHLPDVGEAGCRP